MSQEGSRESLSRREEEEKAIKGKVGLTDTKSAATGGEHEIRLNLLPSFSFATSQAATHDIQHATT